MILLAVLGFTMPSFVMGLVLVLLFAVMLGWLPSGGQDSWVHGILPIDHHEPRRHRHSGPLLAQRHDRGAWASPLSARPRPRALTWREVVWNHALPNAAVPIVTIVGFMVGSLIAGAVVVEIDVFLAGHRPPAGRLRQPTATSPSCSASCCWSPPTMVMSNLDRRPALRLARSAASPHAAGIEEKAWHRSISPSTPAVRKAERASALPAPIVPLWVGARASCWIAAMVVIGVFSPTNPPYSITAMDLRSRLSAPGNLTHLLGTGRARPRRAVAACVQSIRVSLLDRLRRDDPLGVRRHDARFPRRAFPRLRRAARR